MKMRKLFILLSLVVSGLVANTATAAGSAPVNTTAPSISGMARQGETLTADPGSWSGTQPISFGYQWRRCDNTGAGCTDIGNAAAKTYVLTTTDIGKTLRVRVTGTNTAGTSSVVSAATNLIAAKGTAPVNTTAPSISGSVRQGETLTADPGVWSGTQPISLAYQWRRCDTTGANCADIGNASAKTYTVTSADVGNTLRVHLTATNAVGSSGTDSAATALAAGLPKEAISLDSNRELVVYGGLVRLSGSVANGKPGETVTIMQQTVPFGHLAPVRPAASVALDAEGAFSVSLVPRIHTVYLAETQSGEKSNPVAVNVRPWLPLSHAGLHRYLLRAFGARTFVGKYAIVERWNRAAQVWVAIRRVYLTRSAVAGLPTIVSLATFRLPLSGVMLRAIMPLSQTVPGYVSGSSKGITAH